MPILHILHTNDMHNQLTPAKAAFIKDLKAHFQPDVLLLDAGDAVGAGNLGTRGKEPILTLMAETGYDAMTMGNRESHPTQSALLKKLKDARVPVLAANLRAKKDRRPPRVVVEEVNFAFDSDDDEIVVTVFGLAPQITAPDSWWAKVTDYVFDDPLKTGLGLSRKLRPEADLLIALTHIGYERDIELCASPDIDLVIGGHSHRAFCPPEQHGHAYLAATEANATHIGHLSVTLTPGEGITAIAGELIALPS
jgi:2',3'-cyclic-nucleotide 2'-phosphodiesterase (5'-nucleotidase family)